MKKIFSLLFEQDESEIQDATESEVVPANGAKPKARKPVNSVDDQIDALILLYESKAIKDDDDKLLESLLGKKLKYLIEQDDAGAPADATDEPAEPADSDDNATSADAPSTSSDPGDVEKAEKDLVPDLDVDVFTKKVARLIINHRNLLRIEDVIINRGKNFLDENYGDAFVAEYMNSLETQFGIKLSEFEDEESVLDAPFAIGANPAGAGISGGGS